MITSQCQDEDGFDDTSDNDDMNAGCHARAGRRTSASAKRWSPTAPPSPPALVGAHHCLCAANPPIACRQSQLQLSSRLPGSQFSHFGQNLNLDQNATGFTLQALLDKDATWW